MLKKAIAKLPNWKEASPNDVQGFRIKKKMTSLNNKLGYYLNECLEIPAWMLSGRTLLKDKTKGTTMRNYRSITCLPVVWKLLTSNLSDEIYIHL